MSTGDDVTGYERARGDLVNDAFALNTIADRWANDEPGNPFNQHARNIRAAADDLTAMSQVYKSLIAHIQENPAVRAETLTRPMREAATRFAEDARRHG